MSMLIDIRPAEHLTVEELAAPPAQHRRPWAVVTAVEVAAAAAAVLLDLIIPTFVLLVIGTRRLPCVWPA